MLQFYLIPTFFLFLGLSYSNCLLSRVMLSFFSTILWLFSLQYLLSRSFRIFLLSTGQIRVGEFLFILCLHRVIWILFDGAAGADCTFPTLCSLDNLTVAVKHSAVIGSLTAKEEEGLAAKEI